MSMRSFVVPILTLAPACLVCVASLGLVAGDECCGLDDAERRESLHPVWVIEFLEAVDRCCCIEGAAR